MVIRHNPQSLKSMTDTVRESRRMDTAHYTCRLGERGISGGPAGTHHGGHVAWTRAPPPLLSVTDSSERAGRRHRTPREAVNKVTPLMVDEIRNVRGGPAWGQGDKTGPGMTQYLNWAAGTSWRGPAETMARGLSVSRSSWVSQRARTWGQT